MRWHYYASRKPKPRDRILYYDGNLVFVANVDKNGFLHADQFYCNRVTCKGKVLDDCGCSISTSPHHLWTPIFIPDTVKI